MKFNVNKVTRSVHKIGYKIKKHSPEILVAAGVVGTVTSTVMACKATTKLSGILEESKEQVEQINAYVEENGYSEKYSEEDQKKDLTIVYTQSTVKVIKLYAPAVAVGALSIAAIVGSHHILKKRNVALAAAYATIDRTFKDYRGRVIERFGERIDKELRYNFKAKEIDKVVQNEDGTETTVKEVVDAIDPNNPNQYSDYAKFFDVGNPYWKKDAEANLMFLRSQERYANDKLKCEGILFLNDVYEMVGIPKTKAGQVVGWVYDPDRDDIDNYVSFGILDLYNEAKRNFVNGYERTILLDFNVDGNVWENM